jgi:hypothetical protein
MSYSKMEFRDKVWEHVRHMGRDARRTVSGRVCTAEKGCMGLAITYCTVSNAWCCDFHWLFRKCTPDDPKALPSDVCLAEYVLNHDMWWSRKHTWIMEEDEEILSAEERAAYLEAPIHEEDALCADARGVAFDWYRPRAEDRYAHGPYIPRRPWTEKQEQTLLMLRRWLQAAEKDWEVVVEGEHRSRLYWWSVLFDYDLVDLHHSVKQWYENGAHCHDVAGATANVMCQTASITEWQSVRLLYNAMQRGDDRLKNLCPWVWRIMDTALYRLRPRAGEGVDDVLQQWHWAASPAVYWMRNGYHARRQDEMHLGHWFSSMDVMTKEEYKFGLHRQRQHGPLGMPSWHTLLQKQRAWLRSIDACAPGHRYDVLHVPRLKWSPPMFSRQGQYPLCSVPDVDTFRFFKEWPVLAHVAEHHAVAIVAWVNRFKLFEYLPGTLRVRQHMLWDAMWHWIMALRGQRGAPTWCYMWQEACVRGVWMGEDKNEMLLSIAEEDDAEDDMISESWLLVKRAVLVHMLKDLQRDIDRLISEAIKSGHQVRALAMDLVDDSGFILKMLPEDARRGVMREALGGWCRCAMWELCFKHDADRMLQNGRVRFCDDGHGRWGWKESEIALAWVNGSWRILRNLMRNPYWHRRGVCKREWKEEYPDEIMDGVRIMLEHAKKLEYIERFRRTIGDDAFFESLLAEGTCPLFRAKMERMRVEDPCRHAYITEMYAERRRLVQARQAQEDAEREAVEAAHMSEEDDEEDDAV